MIKNYNEMPSKIRSIHNGEGLLKSIKIFGEEDFETDLKYISFTSIPPGSSIGFHKHKVEREEVYFILNGKGIFLLDEERKNVKTGDVILTKSGFGHGLENNSNEKMDVFIFWVKK